MAGRFLVVCLLGGSIFAGAVRADGPARAKPKPDPLLKEIRQFLADAARKQKQAADALVARNPKEAARLQDQALQSLAAAKEKLTQLHKQKRAAEGAFFARNLVPRLRFLLESERGVRASTLAAHKAVLANKDKKPNRDNRQAAARLGERQKSLIAVADGIIAHLEEEGSAIGFLEVSRQLRTDMKDVQKRLEKADLGRITQELEQDVIEVVEEMIKALTTNKAKPKRAG
jgi:hypothetical protein